MTPDDLAFDSVHILPEDCDDIEDGEIEVSGLSLETMADNT